MKETSALSYLTIFSILGCASSHKEIGCQHRSTSGRDYAGKANTTIDGIPCQKWSDTQANEHRFTHVGDHNFCLNPIGAKSQNQVWCYTTDPEHERQNCSVPFCPPLKALDFSLDNDWRPDETNSYTHGSLERKTFLRLLLSALLLWWRHGLLSIHVQSSLFSVMTKERSGT